MKKIKIRILRAIALIIVMAQLSSTSMVIASARNISTAPENELNETQNKNAFFSNGNTEVASEHQLIPITNSNKYTANERINLAYDNTGIVNYHYVAEGVTVTESTEKLMQFELVVVALKR